MSALTNVSNDVKFLQSLKVFCFVCLVVWLLIQSTNAFTWQRGQLAREGPLSRSGVSSSEATRYSCNWNENSFSVELDANDSLIRIQSSATFSLPKNIHLERATSGQLELYASGSMRRLMNWMILNEPNGWSLVNMNINTRYVFFVSPGDGRLQIRDTQSSTYSKFIASKFGGGPANWFDQFKDKNNVKRADYQDPEIFKYTFSYDKDSMPFEVALTLVMLDAEKKWAGFKPVEYVPTVKSKGFTKRVSWGDMINDLISGGESQKSNSAILGLPPLPRLSTDLTLPPLFKHTALERKNSDSLTELNVPLRSSSVTLNSASSGTGLAPSSVPSALLASRMRRSSSDYPYGISAVSSADKPVASWQTRRSYYASVPAITQDSDIQDQASESLLSKDIIQRDNPQNPSVLSSVRGIIQPVPGAESLPPAQQHQFHEIPSTSRSGDASRDLMFIRPELTGSQPLVPNRIDSAELRKNQLQKYWDRSVDDKAPNAEKGIRNSPDAPTDGGRFSKVPALLLAMFPPGLPQKNPLHDASTRDHGARKETSD